MSSNRDTAATESADTLRRRIEELERWFQRQDRQIRFLERERQKLSALVNHTDAGFVVLDAKLSILWLNNVCRGWFHKGGVDPLGRAGMCNDLLCGSPQVCAECPAAAALTTGSVSHREMRLELGEAARDIYATAMPIKAPDNSVDECILMLQDVTNLEVQRRSQEALMTAKESAESANRAKSEFLANMSHEVRTPMTCILSMSSYLLDTPLSSEQHECVSIVQSAGESLLTIINDILDYSRIEAGRLSIDPLPFDLVSMVDEVVSLVAAKAEEKGIELVVRYAPDIPRRVVGDVGRIRQTLVNLVGNAIKFTHVGHVFINVEIRRVDAAGVQVRLSVEDTGIGIAPEKLENVFDKFTQADGSITRRYGGTGLGLAISKHLVELMGGEIAVTSAVDAGSTFSFTVPLPVDDPVPALPEGDLRHTRVLVVHPYAKARSVLAEQIAGWKAKVRVVATGSEALDTLRAAQAAGAPFRVAIVAGNVPDLGPDALVQAVRSEPGLGPVALVLLTPRERLTGSERVPAAGFDACLPRAPRPAQLLNALSAICNPRPS